LQPVDLARGLSFIHLVDGAIYDVSTGKVTVLEN
jgi:hypothetical protein